MQHRLGGQPGGVPAPDPDVHDLRSRPRARGHQHRAPAGRDGPAEGDGHPRDAVHLGAVAAQALQAPDPYRPYVGAVPQLERVAHAEGAGPQRPGDDGAGAVDAERAVHPEPDVGRRVGIRQPAYLLGEDRPQLEQSGAGATAHRDRGQVAQRGRRHRGTGGGEGGGRVGEVAAGDGEDSAGDAEVVEGGEVLGGLRHPRVVGGDHEEDRGHRADPGQRGRDEPLVAGDVDERDRPGAVELGPRVPELDGQAAPPLLGEPVGEGAGQRLDQGRLPVVDVAGGGDDVH